MIKLLSVIALVAFLFASHKSDYDIIVNSKGLVQLVKIVKNPAATNVTITLPANTVEANCNSPPASV